MPESDPLTELRRRHRDRLARRIDRLERRSRLFSRVRLAVVVAGALAVFFLYRGGAADTSGLVLIAFVAVFVVVVKRHDRVEESLRQTRILDRIKEQHERRTQLDWSALPSEEGDVDVQHDPFALDLNIVGPRSLHHLIDASASVGGSATLRRWLTDPDPTVKHVHDRQDLVRQLVPLRIFRDHLARLSFVDPRKGVRWDDRWLRRWLAREEVVPELKPWLIGLGLFAGANVFLILAHIFGWLPAIWPTTILIYFAVYFMKYRSVDEVFQEAQDLDMMLDRFRPALVYVERFRFPEGSQAARVATPLHEARPSRRLKTLRRIASLSAMTRNELLWLVLNLLLPWEMLFTYLMHRSKRDLRDRLPEWLEAWYALEAASSLASYADYHPQRTFPEIVESVERPVFEGRDLGHPLLHEDVKVRNDFRVDELGAVILVTGSNMSGKSTFLRTIGANLRLAYAGGPVDAAVLKASCFRVFTSINVVDSVQEGLSHFYAEVQRLKGLLDALEKDGPQLNLIDEIFRGTNNRERLIGSRAFVRSLAGRRAVSFISTHDLELTGLEGDVPQLSNYHFREEVAGDRMTFDYTIRRGPCPTTNALKIMARAGLPVEAESSRDAV